MILGTHATELNRIPFHQEQILLSINYDTIFKDWQYDMLRKSMWDDIFSISPGNNSSHKYSCIIKVKGLKLKLGEKIMKDKSFSIIDLNSHWMNDWLNRAAFTFVHSGAMDQTHHVQRGIRELWIGDEKNIPSRATQAEWSGGTAERERAEAPRRRGPAPRLRSIHPLLDGGASGRTDLIG